MFVAVVTGAIAALATFFAGAAVIRLAEMNNFAGLRTERLVFYVVPGVALAAGLLGALCALPLRRRLLQTMATTSSGSVGAIMLAGCIVYMIADKPPKEGGQPLVLDFEIRVPASLASPDQVATEGFFAPIFETPDAHWHTHVDLKRVVRTGSDTIIPGHARLRSSRSTNRYVLVALGPAGGQWQRVYLPLPGPPPVQDEWSDWIAATEDSHAEELRGADRTTLRYRVQIGDPRKLAQDAW